MRDSFSRLHGNGAVKKRLSDAISEGTLPHAFLIIGPDGSGKKTLAGELAAALNCERRRDGAYPLPCHSCNTCRRIAEGSFTDIHFLRRAADKATVGVEELKLFKEDMFLSATESDFKVYIIEEADRLTVNAQNAMLTVLEEPPPNVIILLLARSGDSILTTVKSRAQSIFMQRFTPSELREYLTAQSDRARAARDSSPESFEGVLMSADGRIGKALSLISPKEADRNSEDRAVTAAIVDALRLGVPYSELYAALCRLPSGRQELLFALEALLTAIRDIILIKRADDSPLLFYTDRERARETASGVSGARLLGIYGMITDAIEDVTRNVGTQAITASLGAKIKLI